MCYRIPNKRKLEWLIAIRRPLDTFVIQQRICSLHFEKTDFERIGQKKVLKEGVIPTKNLPDFPEYVFELVNSNKSSSTQPAAQQHKQVEHINLPEMLEPKECVILFEEKEIGREDITQQTNW